MNTKLPIGDDIDLCSLEELKAVVEQFIALKEQDNNTFEPLADMMGSAVEIPKT